MDSIANIVASPRDSRATEEALARIGALDEQVKAWIEVDAAGARAAATARQGGLLAGVPVGIKDIFDVAGLPTRFGAPPFAWQRPERDSDILARLRAAGAIILGKTATTAFAYLDPAETRNPWNLEHTPGGSSSGSAAAVAAGMAALAIGSQTVGSVLRPAAYCGIVGLKPAHGWTSLAGVHPLAPSLDHAGLFTRSVTDAAIAYEALGGSARPQDDLGDKAPSFGLLRAYSAAAATPETATHLDAIAARAGEAGGWVEQVSLPLMPQDVHDITNSVLAYEAGRVHAALFAANEAEYPPHLADLVRRGLAMSEPEYNEAENRRSGLKRALAPLLGTFDALLLPVAPSTAPRSLASTGSSIFCSLASLCGCPSISIPTGVSEEGLPTAVQLVGLETGPLLRAARWLETAVAFNANPSLLSPA